MSQPQSVHCDELPAWFWALLGAGETAQRDVRLRELGLEMRGGLPRGVETKSEAQAQTQDTFGYKWQKRETYESESGLAAMPSPNAYIKARLAQACACVLLASHAWA